MVSYLFLIIHEGIVVLCDRFDRRVRSARGGEQQEGYYLQCLHGMGWCFICKTRTGFEHTCLEGVHACLEVGVVNYYFRLEPGYNL